MTDPREPGSDGKTRAFRYDPSEPLPPHLDPRGGKPKRAAAPPAAPQPEPQPEPQWEPAGPRRGRDPYAPQYQEPPRQPQQPYQQPYGAPPGPPPRQGRPRQDRRGGGGPGLPGIPRPHRPKWRRWLLAFVLVVVLYLAFLIIVPFIAWQNVNRVDATPDGNRPSETPGTTYLLVGSDSRAGLTREQQKKLGTKNQVTGARTDSILVLHVTDGDGPDLLLSLPRDSIVDIPGNGEGKINSAFSIGGAKLLVRTVEQNTGIRIDDYVEIGLGGFQNVIDAVNGIEICPPKRVKDKKAAIDIPAGCQEADGATALGYARSRHAFAQGDVARAQHQREVINATASEVLSIPTFLLPWRYWDVWSSGADALTVGDNVGVWDMQRFARAMHGGGTKQCVVPIIDLAVHWDPVKAPRLFKQIRADDTGAITCTKQLGK